MQYASVTEITRAGRRHRAWSHDRATYHELWAEADRAARALIANGVEPGDRVGIWSPNRYERVVLQLASARVGAILVTINPAYKSAELEYALRTAGVSLLVLAPGFRQSDCVAMLREVGGECPQLRATVVLGEDWDAFLVEGAAVSGDVVAEREAALATADATQTYRRREFAIEELGREPNAWPSRSATRGKRSGACSHGASPSNRPSNEETP